MNDEQHTSLAPLTEDGERETNDRTLLTATEVAAYLRIHPKKVYTLPIPQVRISDRRVRYHRADVAAYVRRSRRDA